MTSSYPLVNLLHLRSTTANQVPVNLEAGQIAFNLYDALNTSTSEYGPRLFVGTGGNARVDAIGTDLTASALVTSAITGEVITAGKGWTTINLSLMRDPIVPSATAPAAPTTSWPLWLATSATDVLGNAGKLTFWNGSTWTELVSDVGDGGVF